jgi:hypothetical protein
MSGQIDNSQIPYIKSVDSLVTYENNSDFSSGKSRIRIVHNVANGSDVDIYMDGTKVMKKFEFGKISSYIELRSGIHVISVNLTSTKNTILNGELDLVSGKAYTLIVHGLANNPASIKPMMLVDKLACPPPGKAVVRIIHAAAGVSNIDVYEKLGTSYSQLFTGVSYGQFGNPEYLVVNAAKTEIFIIIPNTATNPVPKQIGPIDLYPKDGGIYTSIVSGAGTKITALISEDSKGSCIILK